MKRQCLIIFTWLLLLTTPILASTDKSLAEDKEKQAEPKGLVEIIFINTPGILTGLAGILTGVSAIITARQSRKQSQKENEEFRSQLLKELVQNKGEFLELIRKQGDFTTARNVDQQFEECEKAFDNRLREALNKKDIKDYLQDICHLITREQFNKELKECRFINANPEARENLIAALTIELKSSDNRQKLDLVNQSEVLKQVENISMQNAKKNYKEIQELEEKLKQIISK